MNRNIWIGVAFLVFCSGCATVEEREDHFFIPVYLAESGIGDTTAAAFDEPALLFKNIEELSTVAFFRGTDDGILKHTGSNGITLLSAKREEIRTFHPNTTNFLLMKTGFLPGSSFVSGYFLGLTTSYYESSSPNRYYKDIWLDIDEVVEEYIETEYALLAVNTGSVVLEEVYIVDVLQEPVNYIASRYAVSDQFLPLNVELAQVTSVEHKVIRDNGKKVLIFKVIPGEEGILPGHVVEILVSVGIARSDLMREEHKK